MLYKTHNGKLLAIIKVFKTWNHYSKDCKYQVFIFPNNNNLQHFIDIKSLSFKQIYLTQEISRYNFQIKYY